VISTCLEFDLPWTRQYSKNLKNYLSSHKMHNLRSHDYPAGVTRMACRDSWSPHNLVISVPCTLGEEKNGKYLKREMVLLSKFKMSKKGGNCHGIRGKLLVHASLMDISINIVHRNAWDMWKDWCSPKDDRGNELARKTGGSFGVLTVKCDLVGLWYPPGQYCDIVFHLAMRLCRSPVEGNLLISVHSKLILSHSLIIGRVTHPLPPLSHIS